MERAPLLMNRVLWHSGWDRDKIASEINLLYSETDFDPIDGFSPESIRMRP
jgi:hypothetical protein